MSDSHLTLALANTRSEIGRLTEAVDRFARRIGTTDEDLHNIHLILDELVINVIKYAFRDAKPHTIDVRLALNGRRLTMTIEDDGREFDPTTAPAPVLDIPIEERPIGGLGIHIVRTLSDSVTYRREHGRNILTVVRTLQDVATPS
jgi:anti-sigma regulatory factor (Ser/Thr protein kinase)